VMTEAPGWSERWAAGVDLVSEAMRCEQNPPGETGGAVNDASAT